VTRIEGDRYYTPDDVALACVGALPCSFYGHALEPHCGGGAFVRALRWHRFQKITTVDVDPNAGPDLNCDFLQIPRSINVDCIVGNPPFADAEAHVRHALSLTPRVAFLLRLGFLASQKRAALFEKHRPAMVCVMSKRPSFTGQGTDNSDYAFVIWDGETDETKMGWI